MSGDQERSDPGMPGGPGGASGGVSDGGDAAEAADAGQEAREAIHGLIRRAQAGEEAAFGELVKLHERRAWRVARNMLPSDEDAEDVAQEAFMRVFRSLDRFDFQHDFSTWLYRIVTNLAIDTLRKRRPAVASGRPGDEDEVEIEHEDPRDERPSDGIEAEETAGEVRDCLNALAPHFQAVLVLRELEGLPCTEIADIVGATHVTVRWRLHRGRKLFQEEWERRVRLREQKGSQSASEEAGDKAAKKVSGKVRRKAQRKDQRDRD